MYNINSGWGAHFVNALHSIKPTLGKVFFVGDSSTVDIDRVKQTFKVDPDGEVRYFDDLEECLNSGSVVANRGDVILVAPGHTETMTATDITLDIAGVTVIGLGSGSLMPQIVYNNAAAELSVSADNVTLQGLRFTASVTAVAIGIEIEDGVDYTTIRNCVFDTEAAGTDEFNASIHMVNNNTGVVIEDNVFDMGIAGAVAAIHMDADTAKTVIRNNIIRGDYSTACIVGDTTASTNILIEGNLLVNGVGGDINSEPGIELLTGTTGVIRNNMIVANLATLAASIVADACLLFQNYYNEDVSSAGTGGLIGTASAND